MTPEQIQLVRDSFAKVVPIKAQAADLFYGRLFEVAPAVRPMFKADVSEQGKKLMAALAMVVGSLDNLGEILPAVETMARRHVSYGAQEGHYEVVGDCLLWTLGQGLGDDFTPEVEAAWTKAYTTLAGAMISAAREAA
ncbi:globin family protein [Phenylobacterium soli]|uniref:Hemin receptor n=1 Tax=Phenylobacterium soli TaxID=2170551 RepID=A0A328AF71_9CAUL|nr:globin family protein [Phenylobacterium soli]RAK53299.1 hemin receptor [Phenylobacterium soli]